MATINPIQAEVRNCDTCALTFPHCGKSKRAGIGYCREPFVPKFAFKENHLTQTVEIKSLVGGTLNKPKETEEQK
jgi:hypothetical protein